MALSSDLISKFVKATKDEPVDKKETVVYGVVTQTNPIRVRLVESNSTSDSSTVYTEEVPVTTTTTVVEVGDKVECTIKNHKLSITGTTDCPAARSASTVDITHIEAANGRIDNLVSANVEVQDTLTAHNADIENLKVANVDIAGRLTAAEADIDHLQALDIDVETLNAAKAFVEDLKASHADIDYLVSTVAELDNLIFGSATGNVIQTTFSNAVISQLGDAQIKSAMIESVSAGKITAGDIITNNVRIKSEDGSLIISDETLQISDNSRVRVQIGKDASNDYSINIWDQNGKLMFSKGGITDAAIKEAIIRNDMVSDTANIHASKLDIDSLFEEINDGSNTIKSTKVKLDDRNQTLDVAFKSLTNEVTSQGNTISSQGTKISAIQGQISSKIWQQDINTAKNEMSTQYSTLEQEVGSFKTTVSETYATNADLDNLEIGGRNLLQGTNRGKQHWSVNGYDGSYTVEEYTDIDGVVGVKLVTNAASTSWNYGAFWMANTLPLLLPETEYVLSFDMLTDVNESLNLSIRKSDGLKILTSTSSTIQTNGDEKWHKYKFVITTNDLNAGIDNQCLYFSRFNAVGYRIIKNLKLEKGNIPTDWTSAPEDVENRVSSAETKISQNANSINLTATNLANNYSTTTQMNAAIEVRTNGITSTVRELQTNFDGLSIGGRNLHTGSTEDEIRLNDYNGVGGFKHFTKFSFDASNPEYIGKEFTISLWAKSPNGATSLSMYNSNDDPRYFRFSTMLDDSLGDEWKYYKYTFVNKDSGATHTGNFTRVEFYASSQLGVLIKKLKVELGNRATDWTPAPEDFETKIVANRTLIEQTATDLTVQIESASKTATNYLEFSSSGLVIGDLTTDTLGKNVLIDSDSVDIRNGTTTLASFGADYLYLAKNSRNATIDLCNGLATLYHESKYSYDTMFVIDTGNTTEIMGLINPLCVTSVDDLDQVSIQFANANGVMGGIGIVGSYLRRFGSNMFDTYTILDSGNYFDVMDDGWHYTGGYAENFTQYNNETHSKVRYRKVGGVVEVRGALKATTTIEGSDTKHTMFTLPEGYRPDCRIVQRCQGSGMHTWMLTVEESGAVTFSRYGVGTSYSDIGTTVWLPIQITFLVN